MPSAGEITLFTVDVTLEPLDIFPIEFGISEETGLNVVGEIFGTSKLELVGNGRWGCGIWDVFKGTMEGGGDGLDPSWFGRTGLDWAEIPFPDFDGDNDKGVVDAEAKGNIDGNNL